MRKPEQYRKYQELSEKAFYIISEIDKFAIFYFQEEGNFVNVKQDIRSLSTLWEKTIHLTKEMSKIPHPDVSTFYFLVSLKQAEKLSQQLLDYLFESFTMKGDEND